MNSKLISCWSFLLMSWSKFHSWASLCCTHSVGHLKWDYSEESSISSHIFTFGTCAKTSLPLYFKSHWLNKMGEYFYFQCCSFVSWVLKFQVKPQPLKCSYGLSYYKNSSLKWHSSVLFANGLEEGLFLAGFSCLHLFGMNLWNAPYLSTDICIFASVKDAKMPFGICYLIM